MPLETCVSMTQGMIGYWLQNALDRALHAKGKGGHAATVITRVAVRIDMKHSATRQNRSVRFTAKKKRKN
jgi:carbamate kinase